MQIKKRKKIVLLSKQNKEPEKVVVKNTVRQQRLIELIQRNLIAPDGKKMSMQDMMIKAGFTKSTAHQQTRVLSSVRIKLDPIVKRLIAHRNKVIDLMEKKLPRAAYEDLYRSLNTLTKNIQLLSGGATDRPDLMISDDQYQRILDQANKRSKDQDDQSE